VDGLAARPKGEPALAAGHLPRIVPLVTRTSAVIDSVEKRGCSGPMTFVTVRHGSVLFRFSTLTLNLRYSTLMGT
jgi:hypothetical protein